MKVLTSASLELDISFSIISNICRKVKYYKTVISKKDGNVKLALIIEGMFISKTVTSLQIKVHECYVKPLKPRESLLKIEEEDEEQSDIEEINEPVFEDLVISEEENE